ncbi:MAG: folylpolyglutamate synthase/dihydrofolate synthase family protein [Dehalococcoidia bacterium]|nr:folylpolyglutamate synthase/dihydrofolate synthase family protein [Dehalococcoidia bacterium]
MNYQAALNYILSFTDYEKVPAFLYRADNFDLRRVAELLDRLGNPHLTSPAIHVAGTKGKGSTAAMIASALSAAGYRTGLYTSPHLHTFRERITVDGEMITEEEFSALTEKLQPEIDEVNRRHDYGEITTFEILTALAFAFFMERRVDFQVLEVGLGGRLDATNVVMPRIAVITSISLDHAEVLGDSLAEIAGEKAGIIKPGALVISAPQSKEVEAVIEEVCRSKGVPLITVGRDVTWRKVKSDLSGQFFEVKGREGNHKLIIPLLGEHQLENAAVAVAALEALDIGVKDIARGLAQVQWPGRLEILRHEPLFLADGAHNADSANRLKETIEKYLHFDRLILILGASSDKDIAGIVGELAPLSGMAIVTRSRHPRALAPELLLEELEKQGVKGELAESVSSAAERAMEMAGPRDLICATGSLFVAAEAREYIKGIPHDVF